MAAVSTLQVWRIIDNLIFVFMVRRPLLATFEARYRFIMDRAPGAEMDALDV